MHVSDSSQPRKVSSSFIFITKVFRRQIMPRATRTTAEQQEMLINFISENKVMLSGKCHPLNVKEIDKLWSNLTEQLNSIRGAKKSIEEWKRFLVEWKSKTRKKARDQRTEITGTGGGTAQAKKLTELEEQLMSLIGWVSVTGAADLPQETEVIEETELASEISVPSSPLESSATKSNNIMDILDMIPIENMEVEIINETPTDRPIPKRNERTSTPKKQNFKFKKSKSASNSNVGALHKSAVLYAQSAEQISTAICQFAVGINRLAEAIEKYAAATEKLADATASKNAL